MAKLICKLKGVRGRELILYDTKCVIITQKTAGSLLTGNFTDGEKTIYLCDVVGVQFKRSGGLIGYLQFETPAMQMNNENSNMFSENTFTFENGKNGVTNELMWSIYRYVTDRIEELKYGTSIIHETPNFDTKKRNYQQEVYKQPAITSEVVYEETAESNNEEYEMKDTAKSVYCFGCGELLAVPNDQTAVRCPWCNTEMIIE